MHCYHLLLALICFISPTWTLTYEEMSKFVSRPYTEHNTGLQGQVSVTYAGPGGHQLLLTSNGIPDHDTGTFPNADNPNSIEPHNNTWHVPANPQRAALTSCLPMGPIAMSVNGVPMFNAYTQTCCDAGETELDLFDMCTGHPAPGNVYHYHIYPTCLEDIICNNPSDIIGVAFDGFPIYGPIDEDGRQLTKADLDECNGKDDSNGNYRYHIIKEFPYIMGCYRGKTVDEQLRPNCECTEPVDPCTEFGGGTGGNTGGEKPPPPPNQGRKKRDTSTTTFQCCTDENSCSASRIFIHDDVDGDGNGSSSVDSSVAVLTLSVVAILINIL